MGQLKLEHLHASKAAQTTQGTWSTVAMRSFEKSFEAQASAPVEARMVAAADAPHGGGGARGRHHFAFEIVLDEVSDLTCFTAQYLKGSRQAKPSFALRLEQGGAAEACEHTVAVVDRRKYVLARPQPAKRGGAGAAGALEEQLSAVLFSELVPGAFSMELQPEPYPYP